MYNYFMVIGYVDSIEKFPNSTKVWLKIRSEFKDRTGNYWYDTLIITIREKYMQDLLEEMNLLKKDKVGFKGRIERIASSNETTLLATRIIDFTSQTIYDTM